MSESSDRFQGDRFPGADPERLRRVFEQTEIRRSPITGIVRGYHTLQFSLVGPGDATRLEAEATDTQTGEDAVTGSVLLTGRISVSPRLVIPVSHEPERFGDAFPEETPFMDRSLVARVFTFAAGKGKGLRVRNEHLAVESFVDPDTLLLERVLDDHDRAETVDRAVIWCPDPRFYPVSLEKFILSVLDRELG